MMPDETLKELWDVKDAIAREHKWDLHALVKGLRRAAKGSMAGSEDAPRPGTAAEQGAAGDVQTATRSGRT